MNLCVKYGRTYPVNFEGVASAGGERGIRPAHDLLGFHARAEPELGQDTLERLVDRNVVHLDREKAGQSGS